MVSKLGMDSQLLMKNLSFTSCSSYFGGAMFIQDFDYVRLVDSTFNYNSVFIKDGRSFKNYVQ